MQVELRFFASFREAVGSRVIEREYNAEQSVGDILVELSDEHGNLQFFEEDGELRQHLSIMVNGRDISFLDGLETSVEDGDVLAMFPPVAGGSDRVVRSFRGISTRAAIHYLTRLGGERIEDDTVEGSGWRAQVSAQPVEIGPTLRLTEVTVTFEGSCERLNPVVDGFAQKAMRAGG